MYGFRQTLAIWILILAAPLAASGQNAGNQKEFEDCIVRYGSRAPSPQAAVILQRACFYKYRYGKGYLTTQESAAAHKKLSKIYTPEVCDCVFDKMPATHPDVPAPAVLDYCVKNPKKPVKPEGNN